MIDSGLFRKLLSTVLLAVTLFSALHHHNDLKTHNDCPVCVLQSNLSVADTPATLSLQEIDAHSDPVVTRFVTLRLSSRPESVFARAPPLS
ncbi:hypothetical protein NNO_1712 [Hydrogenimonas sp.]|nr:hypothetical protein NNO_1712 [Hydrogenimonas sp.]